MISGVICRTVCQWSSRRSHPPRLGVLLRLPGSLNPVQQRWSAGQGQVNTTWDMDTVPRCTKHTMLYMLYQAFTTQTPTVRSCCARSLTRTSLSEDRSCVLELQNWRCLATDLWSVVLMNQNIQKSLRAKVKQRLVTKSTGINWSGRAGNLWHVYAKRGAKSDSQTLVIDSWMLSISWLGRLEVKSFTSCFGMFWQQLHMNETEQTHHWLACSRHVDWNSEQMAGKSKSYSRSLFL